MLGEDDSLGRMNRGKSAMAFAPIGRNRGQPTGDLHDISVFAKEVEMNYRFVMSDAIAN